MFYWWKIVELAELMTAFLQKGRLQRAPRYIRGRSDRLFAGAAGESAALGYHAAGDGWLFAVCRAVRERGNADFDPQRQRGEGG